MSNVSYSKQFERETDKAYDELARLNRYDNCATYAQSLERPSTKAYRVMPDGTVEFLR
jgi:hypothetical protein